MREVWPHLPKALGRLNKQKFKKKTGHAICKDYNYILRLGLNFFLTFHYIISEHPWFTVTGERFRFENIAQPGQRKSRIFIHAPYYGVSLNIFYAKCIFLFFLQERKSRTTHDCYRKILFIINLKIYFRIVYQFSVLQPFEINLFQVILTLKMIYKSWCVNIICYIQRFQILWIKNVR